MDPGVGLFVQREMVMSVAHGKCEITCAYAAVKLY